MTFKISHLSRFRSPYDVLGYMLRLLSALWHRELNSRLGEIDLTEMQFVILMGLGWLQEERGSGVSQRELAASCSCSTALASQVIKSLVRKKLVSVLRDAEDGRAHVVRLTKSGEAKIHEALNITDKADSAFWDDHRDQADKLSAVLKTLIIEKLAHDDAGFAGAMPGLIESNTIPKKRSGRA